ncbi:phosphoesterase, partial [Streptomyces sp. NPDC051362]
MRDTPRPQGTVGDSGSSLPQLRPGRALAHTPGASGSGSPHRSDSRPPQTPRGARQSGPDGRPRPPPPGAGGAAHHIGHAALHIGLFTMPVTPHRPHAPAGQPHT